MYSLPRVRPWQSDGAVVLPEPRLLLLNRELDRDPAKI